MELAPTASTGSGFQQHRGGGAGTTGEAPRPSVEAPAAVSGTGDASRLPVVLLSGAFVTLGGGLFALRRRTRVG